MADLSISPSGEQFTLPKREEYGPELERLKGLANLARQEGKEVVVVMGVGFVGAVMASIIADTTDKKTGKPSKFVIGCQRPSPRSYWKIPLLNAGVSPVKAEDPEVDLLICFEGQPLYTDGHRCWREVGASASFVCTPVEPRLRRASSAFGGPGVRRWPSLIKRA
jgi:hypothetical protein